MGGVIKTAVELCDLPVGAVVADRSGRAWQKSAMPHCCWRSYDVLPLCDEELLRGQQNGVTLVYDPTAQANADARPEALRVAKDMLDAELGLSHDTDDIAKRVVDALAGDGLIHYSPVPWDFTPGCSLTVHGPGIIPVEDLAAAPPGSMLITEAQEAWLKYQGDIWMLQMDQQYIRMFIQRHGLHPQPKSSSDLSNAGPAVLITTHWEE